MNVVAGYFFPALHLFWVYKVGPASNHVQGGDLTRRGLHIIRGGAFFRIFMLIYVNFIYTKTYLFFSLVMNM